MKTKTLKNLFIFSVLLNLFLLGHFVFVMSIKSQIQANNPMLRFEKAINALEPEYQEQIRKKWKAQRTHAKTHINNVFDSMNNAKQILTATEFDITKLKVTHDELSQRDDVMKVRMFEMVSEIALSLPEDQRVIFFEQAIPDEMPFIIKKQLDRQ